MKLVLITRCRLKQRKKLRIDNTQQADTNEWEEEKNKNIEMACENE